MLQSNKSPSIHGLGAAEVSLQKQLDQFDKLRVLAGDLEFVPLDVETLASFDHVVAADGGIMDLHYHPFDLSLVQVADSGLYPASRFLLPTSGDLDDGAIAFIDQMPEISAFLNIVGAPSINNLSLFPVTAEHAMEIAEFARLAMIIGQQDQKRVLVLKDGLMRTKLLKRECRQRFRRFLEARSRHPLIGVAKHSALLQMLYPVLAMNGLIPPGKTGYIQVPWEIEQLAYDTPGLEVQLSLGSLLLAKLSPRSNLLLTIELPTFGPGDRCLYPDINIDGFMSALEHDSLQTFPFAGYPRAIQRAHERAAWMGMTAALWRSRIADELLAHVGEPRLKQQLGDAAFRRVKLQRNKRMVDVNGKD